MRSRCRCSMCPAIHINSRSWLRSSSTHEPSDPPLRVVICRCFDILLLAPTVERQWGLAETTKSVLYRTPMEVVEKKCVQGGLVGSLNLRTQRVLPSVTGNLRRYPPLYNKEMQNEASSPRQVP